MLSSVSTPAGRSPAFALGTPTGAGGWFEPDESEWLGENQGSWLDLVEAHYSDIRAAMARCLQSIFRPASC